MHVLYDTYTERVIFTGDRIDCLRRAIGIGELGTERKGLFERLEQRVEQLEDVLATIIAALPDDVLNNMFRARNLVVYNDSTLDR